MTVVRRRRLRLRRDMRRCQSVKDCECDGRHAPVLTALRVKHHRLQRIERRQQGLATNA